MASLLGAGMTRTAGLVLLICAVFASVALYLWPDMIETERVETVTITWKREVPTACGPQEKDGCAQWSGDRTRCVVTMRADSSDAIKLHEFLHCFGYSHRE